MKKFSEKLIGVEEKTDLDMCLPFFEEETRNEVELPSLNYCSVPSLDIDETIELLIKLKEKGSNRVTIGINVDHHGYYFYGTKLEQIK